MNVTKNKIKKEKKKKIELKIQMNGSEFNFADQVPFLIEMFWLVKNAIFPNWYLILIIKPVNLQYVYPECTNKCLKCIWFQSYAVVNKEFPNTYVSTHLLRMLISIHITCNKLNKQRILTISWVRTDTRSFESHESF